MQVRIRDITHITSLRSLPKYLTEFTEYFLHTEPRQLSAQRMDSYLKAIHAENPRYFLPQEIRAGLASDYSLQVGDYSAQEYAHFNVEAFTPSAQPHEPPQALTAKFSFLVKDQPLLETTDGVRHHLWVDFNTESLRSP